MFGIKDIEKLAELSRINISPKEKEIFLGDISSILNYVDQIKEAVGAAEIELDGGELINILRDDENPHDSGKFTKNLLETVPEKERGYVKVKKIL